MIECDNFMFVLTYFIYVINDSILSKFWVERWVQKVIMEIMMSLTHIEIQTENFKINSTEWEFKNQMHKVLCNVWYNKCLLLLLILCLNIDIYKHWPFDVVMSMNINKWPKQQHTAATITTTAMWNFLWNLLYCVFF